MLIKIYVCVLSVLETGSSYNITRNFMSWNLHEMILTSLADIVVYLYVMAELLRSKQTSKEDPRSFRQRCSSSWNCWKLSTASLLKNDSKLFINVQRRIHEFIKPDRTSFRCQFNEWRYKWQVKNNC